MSRHTLRALLGMALLTGVIVAGWLYGYQAADPKGAKAETTKGLLVHEWGVFNVFEDENAARYYRMETVPYVQYFSKGVGLHGAFWHRSFGQVRSHGCVNALPTGFTCSVIGTNAFTTSDIRRTSAIRSGPSGVRK